MSDPKVPPGPLDEKTDSEEPKADSAGSQWRHRVGQTLENASRPAKASARNTSQTKARDKTKKIQLVALISVLVIGFGLVLLTKPPAKKGGASSGQTGEPNLGRPGQENRDKDKLVPEEKPSLVPQLSASSSKELFEGEGRVSEEDIRALAKRQTNWPQKTQKVTEGSAAESEPAQSSDPGNSRYALKDIAFSDSKSPETLAEVEARLARLEGKSFYGGAPLAKSSAAAERKAEQETEESLSLPSMIYVQEKSEDEASAQRQTVTETPDFLEWSGLDSGTRLAARLETAVTTAGDMPVVAIIEYNYQKAGEIVVPAGSRVYGKINQANRHGYLGIRFQSMELPGIGTVPIEGTALSLQYSALKGRVDGRNRFKKALVQTFTGVGALAAQVVGGGGFNGPIDQGVLVRDRIATNIGRTGDRQLQELTLNQRIVVTVPANTRIFVVLRKPAEGSKRSTEPAPRAIPQNGAREREYQQTLAQAHEALRELSKLREEQNRMIRAAMGQSSQPVPRGNE